MLLVKAKSRERGTGRDGEAWRGGEGTNDPRCIGSGMTDAALRVPTRLALPARSPSVAVCLSLTLSVCSSAKSDSQMYVAFPAAERPAVGAWRRMC